MRYFLILVCLLSTGLVGCVDTSRDDYDIPDAKALKKDIQLAAILENLSERIKSNPSSASNYYKRASWHYKSESYEEALIDISRAERINPNSGDILYLKSLILTKLGKEGALENALFAEDQGLETPGLYSLIGNLYLDKKDLGKAKTYFAMAESIYPYDADTFNGKGRLYAMQNDTLTAINNYKRALSLKKGTFKYFDDLIKIYGEARYIDSALNLNERAIQQFPENKELIYNKALILEKTGLADSSIRIYRQFVKLEPDRADVYERIGDIYNRNRNFSAAFVNYNKWAEQDSENVKAKLKAARAYVAQANFPAAKYYLNKALEKHPDNAQLKAELAAVNYRLEHIQYGRGGTGDRKFDTDNLDEDSRVFDRSFEINQIPKRKPTTIGRDSTRI